MTIYKMSKKTQEETLARMKARLKKEREEKLSEEQITILAIKGAISELPPEHEERCNELAAHIRKMIIEAGSPVGELAIALVGAELQAAL
jgi:hypothetical protein